MQNFLSSLQKLLAATSKKPTVSNTETQSTPVINTQPSVVISAEIPAKYKFGARSRSRLDTCHPDIVAICEEVIKVYDFSVLEGLRPLEKQQEYFQTGRSKLDGVNKKSKHQDDGSGKSRAIDIMPYAHGTNAFSGKQDDLKRFYFLAGIMYSTAERLFAEGRIQHKIRWGGDWQQNLIYKTASEFTDLPHFELVNP